MAKRWARIRRSTNYKMHLDSQILGAELNRRILHDRQEERRLAKEECRVYKWIKREIKDVKKDLNAKIIASSSPTTAAILQQQMDGLIAEEIENRTLLDNALYLKDYFNGLMVEMEEQLHVFEEGQVEAQREDLVTNIEELLTDYTTRKWVTILEIADFHAIGMLSNLGGQLLFTVGRSVTAAQLVFLTPLANRLGIPELSADSLYELSDRQVNVLPQNEAFERVGFQPRGPPPA